MLIVTCIALIIAIDRCDAQNGLQLIDHYDRINQLNKLQQSTIINHDDRYDSILQHIITDASITGWSSDCNNDIKFIQDSVRLAESNDTTARTNQTRAMILSQLDAAAKFPAGVLRGNFRWYGAYAECNSIDVPMTNSKRHYRGGYCRFLYAINGKKDGKCPPIPESISRDICLPASCANKRDALPLLQNVTGGDSSSICTVSCLNSDENVLNWKGIVVVVIILIIIVISIIGTAVDYFWYSAYKETSNLLAKSRLILGLCAFSLFTNIVSIMSTRTAPGQIGAIHCIRFFSMAWIIAGHVFSLMLALCRNPVDMLPQIGDTMSQMLTSTYFAVDSFFFLSGLLLGYMWFKELKKNRKQTMSTNAWIMYYVHRIIRLSPPYYMALAFYIWVLPYLTNRHLLYLGLPILGPSNCDGPDAVHWWTNFLYLNNIIGYDKQCYVVSWYLATDMQIYIFAPLILIPLAIRPLYGLITSAALIALSTAVNIFTVYHFHMPPSDLVTPLRKVDPAFKDHSLYTFYMYDAPWIRFPVYLIGLLVGYYLQMNKRPLRIHPVINIVCWLVSFVIMLTAIMSLRDWVRGDTDMTPFTIAMYSSFSKIGWGIALAWIVISCFYGHGGPINRFLSWNIWMPFGRLTYCSYLIHPIVALYIVGMSDQELHFTSFTDMVLHQIIPVAVMSFSIAAVWSSCFEISTGKVEMLLLGHVRRPAMISAAAVSAPMPTIELTQQQQQQQSNGLHHQISIDKSPIVIGEQKAEQKMMTTMAM